MTLGSVAQADFLFATARKIDYEQLRKIHYLEVALASYIEILSVEPKNEHVLFCVAEIYFLLVKDGGCTESEKSTYMTKAKHYFGVGIQVHEENKKGMLFEKMLGEGYAKFAIFLAYELNIHLNSSAEKDSSIELIDKMFLESLEEKIEENVLFEYGMFLIQRFGRFSDAELLWSVCPSRVDYLEVLRSRGM